MAHLPYRDNPELVNVSEDERTRIGMLTDDLQLVCQQLEHEDRCACDPGRRKFWECIDGPLFPSPDPEEMLALLYVRGLLKLPE